MAQVTALSPLGTPGLPYTFAAKDAGIVYVVDKGDVFYFDSANYGSGSWYFEVYYRATSGTAYARLWDITGAAAVADSTQDTTEGSLVRERSVALALVDGREYRVEFGSGDGAGGKAAGAKLIFI